MKSILFGAGGVVLAAAIGLSSCGSGTAATAIPTTVKIGATNFVTLAPTQSTNSPITVGGDLPGTIIPGESTYVVQANDYPSTVASRFKVKYEDFMALNQFELDENGYLPAWQIGVTVKIPAGATVPGSDGAPAAATPTATAADSTAAPVTTEKQCFADDPYTIVNGDAPSNVAARFKTTINKLNQANGGTKGFAGFVVGTQIKIPVEC